MQHSKDFKRLIEKLHPIEVLHPIRYFSMRTDEMMCISSKPFAVDHMFTTHEQEG